MEEHQKEFVTYREFGDKDMTRLMTDILDENSIPYQVEDNSDSLDSTIIGTAHQGFLVKLRSEDFETVNSILETKADEELESIEKDYFMFQFSDEELKDVLVKASEWSHLDVALAQKLLRDRGVEYSRESILEMREEEIKASQKTEEASTFWIVMTYFILLCLVIIPFVKNYFMPIFLILIPFIMGAVYLFSKKVDLAGNKHFTYGIKTRKHGKYLTILGGLVFVIYILLMTTFNGSHLYDSISF